jgi:hypothetical protein
MTATPQQPDRLYVYVRHHDDVEFPHYELHTEVFTTRQAVDDALDAKLRHWATAAPDLVASGRRLLRRFREDPDGQDVELHEAAVHVHYLHPDGTYKSYDPRQTPAG